MRLKKTTSGYEYPLPLAPLPPLQEKQKNKRSKSSSSMDSGVQPDQCDLSTGSSESAASSPNLPSTPVTARQNTYVHDSQNNSNNSKPYEQLDSTRENSRSYQSLRSPDTYEKNRLSRNSVHSYQQARSQSAYEAASPNRMSYHKYQEMHGAGAGQSYSHLNDDAVSRTSNHDYEVLPGTRSQPGSLSGSLRSRGNIPLSISEQTEHKEI